MSIKDVTAYELIKEQELTGIHARGYLLKHKKSGARVLLIANDDENKVFNIGFRTPPYDSTGLPHIMEHSVLCGSKNFPAKDPFVELVKGSLNTFLNAMTYPDKTVYPVASCNDKDFQNLMHIYMDAVLYPCIYERRETFCQEGWSYKLESEDGELTYNGVVYNEMKGAFSSADSVIDRVVLNQLYPDTCYAYESGGDPDVIPQLTYEQFLDFHRKYYHPSNSYIYLYGNMDMEEKLRWLDETYLNQYEAMEIDSSIRLQQPFREMKDVEITYSISNDEPMEENTYLSYNKSVGTSLDKELYLAFEFIDYALLSGSGAPIKEALLKAGIGKNITGAFDNGIYQPIFTIEAVGADKEQKEEFVSIIERELRRAVAEGINKQSLYAAINEFEFSYREGDFGLNPKGLMYGLQILDSWLYDENEPFMHVEALETLEHLKAMVETDYYEKLVQEYLIDNPHGVMLTAVPEQGRTSRLDSELADKLAAYKESLSKEEMQKLVDWTAHMEAYQSQEDPVEILEKIPMLTREDLNRKVPPYLNEELEMAGVPFIHHCMESSGIGHLKMYFKLDGLSLREMQYLAIMSDLFDMVDTDRYTYGELNNEMRFHLGGLSSDISIIMRRQEEDTYVLNNYFAIKSKALYHEIPKVFELVEEIVLHSHLSDAERVKEVLSMYNAKTQARLVAAGHLTAAGRAKSYGSIGEAMREQVGGLEFYRFTDDLAKNFDEKKEEMFAAFEQILTKVFRKENLLLSYVSAKEGLKGMEEMVASFTDKLLTAPFEKKELIIPVQRLNEGFKTSSKVQYVACGGNFKKAGLAYTGALHVLRNILCYDYLWQNIRVKGGAYGCMFNFSADGDAYFASYRDPHLKRTMDVFEGIPKYLEEFDVSDRDMTKFVIGAMSAFEVPLTPTVVGLRSINAYLSNTSYEEKVREREQIIDATKEDIRALAKYCQAILDCKQICVVGSEDAIEENAEMFGEITSIIPA